MCLAVPAQVKSVDDFQAEVDVGGVRRTISLMLLPEVQIGDYVYLHAGFAISIVDEEEALEKGSEKGSVAAPAGFASGSFRDETSGPLRQKG